MIDALPLLLGPEGYQISRSVRLRSSASAYFNRTVWGSGNRKTWSYSFWLKRGVLNSERVIAGAYDGTSTWASRFLFTSSNALAFDLGLSAQNQTLTAAVFRDPSAWYHIVLVIDTTQSQTLHSQPDSRVRIYVNGTQQTTSGTLPGLNVDTQFFINTRTNYIGTRNTEYFDGYLTEINFIDGQALTPASFGETNSVTGVWQPKKYTGTYGTNGFYLNFSDNSAATAAAIGKDYSGNGNNWTPNNISVTAGVTYDSMIDVPTLWADGGNGRGNYAVMNPLQTGSYVTQSNGNLTNTGNTATNSALVLASIGQLTSGKWYWEYTQGTVQSETCGVCTQDMSGVSLLNAENIGAYGVGVRASGTVYGGTVGSITSWTAGDVIGIAVDCDNGAAYWSKNGTWLNSGVPTSGSSKTGAVGTWTPSPTKLITPAFGAYNGGSVSATFGQRPFSYTPPSGFKALNTLNLPAPTILKGNQYFDVALQTGNTTGRTVSGLAFQPDLVIVKNRAGSTNRRWGVIDSVRGVNKTLSTALTDAEVTSQTDLLTAFNSDGFTIGADAGLYGWNGFAESYAHFTWKEGATQGFDIVTYTGTGVARSISHSLGVTPSMIIIKCRSTARFWFVNHASISATQNLYLQGTDGVQSDGVFTAKSSSTFSIGSGVGGNANGDTYVAYLFSEVAGFSRFGSYTGNGSTDGPFVFCGFRPRWILVKRTDSTGNWFIWDTARDPHNTILRELYPDSSSAEVTRTGSSDSLDALSNGFKMRFSSTYADRNASGGTYVYAAFSESPFKNALAR